MARPLPPRLLFVCASVVVLAACGSKESRIQSGLDKGAAFVRTADYDKANVEVRNVLQIDPKNAAAFFIAGQIAENRHELQAAFGSYLKAVELQPDLIDAQVALARVYLMAGEVEKADTTVTQALASNPNHAGARTLAIAVIAQRGDVPAAIRQARALVAGGEAVPAETSMMLAGLHASQGDTASAMAVIEAALQREPNHLSLLQVAAQIAGASADAATQQKAADFFRRATAQAPRKIELWNAWALHHTRRNELERAEAVLRASAQSHPEDVQRTLALLDFLASRRGRDVAEAEYRTAVAARPKDLPLRLGLASFYRNAGRQGDARRVWQALIADAGNAPEALIARNQLAADRFAQGRPKEARVLIGEVLKASPRDASALLLRGRMLLADGDAPGAISDLRAAARDQPGAIDVVTLLARAHRQLGEPQLAREVLVDAVKLKPDSAELHLLLAADMADAREFASASAQIDDALKIAPLLVPAHDMRAKLALTQGNPAAAEKTYIALKQLLPGRAAGRLKLGYFYVEQKKYDAALKEFDDAIGIEPAAAEPLRAAVTLLAERRRFDEALSRIQTALSRRPDDADIWLLRGRLATTRGDLPQAEQSLRRAVEIAPRSAAAYQSLAAFMTAQGRTDDGLQALERGAQALPDDLSFASARAESLARAGRRDEAIAAYEALVKRAPDDDAHANNLAYLLIESKGDAPSLERATALTRAFADSNNPGYLDTLGWTRYKLGRYDDAVAVLERAQRLAPQAPLLQLHLGLALHKQGNALAATTHLRKALDGKTDLPGSDEARRLLAQP